MKHSIRQRVINEYGLPVTKVETVQGELGSGIFDKNGKEIFEGDIVRGTYLDRDGIHEYTFPVTFKDGGLCAGECGYPVDDMLAQVNWAKSDELEVVGRVDD